MDNLWTVGLAITGGHSLLHNTSLQSKLTVLWCRECMEWNHLLPYVELKKKEIELPPAPSLEDLVRSIVQDEIDASR